MVKLKLTLKSNRPSTVYSSNGKSFRLKPGSNTLILTYEDYLALAKSLGIKPVDNKKQESAPVEDLHKNEESLPAEEPAVNKSEPENEPVEESANLKSEENTSESVEENKESSTDTEDSVEEVTDSEIDYSTWSTTKLKAEYKRITGKTCKLKKDEIIAFLQEHTNNAE